MRYTEALLYCKAGFGKSAVSSHDCEWQLVNYWRGSLTLNQVLALAAYCRIMAGHPHGYLVWFGYHMEYSHIPG